MRREAKLKMHNIFQRSLGALCMVLWSLLALNTSAWGQTAAPQAQPETFTELPERILTVQVVGNQRVEANTVASYLLFAPGDPFDERRVDLSIKTLYSTNLFADVIIEPRDGNVLIRVVENPIINRVILEGNSALKEDKITDEIEAEPRSIFTRSNVQADVRRIIELYRQSGRFAATVSPKVVQQPQNRVDLIFEITEGPTTGVKQINFIGNNEFSDRKLRKELVTKESAWYKFLESNDNYDPGRIDFDREQIRNFYTDRGFADFRVISAVAELTPDQEDFYITFTLDEGEEYTWGDIKVQTELETIDEDQMLAEVPFKKGEIYKSSLVEEAIEGLTFVTGTSGYAFVDIQPRIKRNRDTKTVDVIFNIEEGPRVYIEKINVVGNTTTLDYVIRREIELAEGDAFNRVLLDRSRNRVRALRYFSDVELTERPGSAPDRAIVDVKVTEQQTGELAFSAGFSSQDAFLVDLSVTQRNLRGRGQLLRFVIQTSSNRRNINFQFQEPRFMGRNLAAGIQVFDTVTEFDATQFRQSRRGAIGTLAFPLTENSRLSARYSLTEENIEVAPGVCTPPPAGQAVSITSLSLCDPITGGDPEARISSILGYTFRWDTRNDPIEPTGGATFSLSQDFAGVGGEARYLRSEARGTIYQGIIDNVVGTLSGQAGFIQGWGGDPIRINDRFFKGSQDFRGYDNAGIGPQLLRRSFENGEEVITPVRALGGNAFALGVAEVSFPLGIPQLSGSVFAEIGTVGLLDEAFLGDLDDPNVASPDNNIAGDFVDDTLALRSMIGASVYWESPFGPLRFDFTEPIQEVEFDDRKSFQFTTRTRF